MAILKIVNGINFTGVIIYLCIPSFYNLCKHIIFFCMHTVTMFCLQRTIRARKRMDVQVNWSVPLLKIFVEDHCNHLFGYQVLPCQ